MFTVVVFHAKKLARWIPDFRSPGRRCAIGIESAKSGDELVEALVRFTSGGNDPDRAVGLLRLEGLYTQAAELESLIDRVRRDSDREVWNESMSTLRANATDLMQRIGSHRFNRSKSLVQSQSRPKELSKAGPGHMVLLLCTSFLSRPVVAAEPIFQLEPAQQQSLLEEASRDYTAAMETQITHPEDAKELFQTAANKYQKLAEAGIHNHRLFTNLGNAYLQSGKLGLAIANYERAQSFDPINRQLAENLKFARDQVNSRETTVSSPFNLSTFLQSARSIVRIGYVPILWTLLMSSCVFWGLAIACTIGVPFAFWRAAALPLFLLVSSGLLMAVFQVSPASPTHGIVVAEKLTLRAGDGESFDQVATIDDAEGQAVEVLVTRGNWTRIQTPHGKVGWTHQQSLEIVTSSVD